MDIWPWTNAAQRWHRSRRMAGLVFDETLPWPAQVFWFLMIPVVAAVVVGVGVLLRRVSARLRERQFRDRPPP